MPSEEKEAFIKGMTLRGRSNGKQQNKEEDEGCQEEI